MRTLAASLLSIILLAGIAAPVSSVAPASTDLSSAAEPAADPAAEPAADPEGEPPTAAAAGACIDGWQRLAIPERDRISAPTAAVTYDGSLAWVLGISSRGVLALRWNGARLVHVDVGPTARAGLLGGIATGRRSLIGAGLIRPQPKRLDALVAGIAGGTWSRVDVPVDATTETTLTGIAKLPSGTAWAVGTSLQDGVARAVALRRSRGRWRADVPVSGKVSSGLLGVAGSPSGDAWAVGWRGPSSGKPRPLIARRTGATWSVSRGAALPSGAAVLTAIDMRDDDDGWAVGYVVEEGTVDHRAVLEHWDGRRWRRAELPWADDISSIPRSIDAAEDGSLWISGAQLATASREARGFVAHGTDDAWQVTWLDTPDDVHSDVKSVAATSDGAVAVGTIGFTSFAMRTCEAEPDAEVTAEADAEAEPDADAETEPDAEAEPDAGVTADVTKPTDADVAFTAAELPIAPPVRASGFTLRDVAAEVGLAMTTLTWDGTSGDFDGDGWDDVFFSRHSEARPVLALGGPDGFRLVPDDVFTDIDRHGCRAADVDADGETDILCVTGRQRGTTINRHELTLSAGTDDRRLERTTLGLSDPLGRGRTLAFIRLDEDEYPEVFITNQPEREDGMPAPNRFFRNLGGRFVPDPGVGLDDVSGGFCAEAVDVDEDGDEDLLHCADRPADGRPPGLRVYLNRDGRLVERSRALGVRPISDVGVAMADVDGDGRDDLVQLGQRQLRVSRGTPSGFRPTYTARLTWAEAVATGDVNGDGRADIYIVRGGPRRNEPDLLLVNDGRGRSFTSVRIPQATDGSGQDVVALDHDQNGLTDFLVLNGRGDERGPVQLLAAFPS